MNDWSVRPLDEVYAAIFIDAIVVKVRDGQVANRPIYAAIGVSLDGERDILGLWAGTGGEGAKFWMSVLTDLRNRGVKDVFFVVCDGLKGLPEVVGNVWPQTIVQTCIIHLIRNTFRLASRRDWDAIKRDVKPIYTAVNAAAARAAFDELAEKWGQRYPAIIRLWDNAWDEFIPFLDYDVEIRTRDLLDERDRVAQRPLPASGQGPRALPDRAGRAEVPLPGHPITGPDRARPGTMDDALEASPQRVRDHLRRPLPGRRDLLTEQCGNTVSDSPVAASSVGARRCGGELHRDAEPTFGARREGERSFVCLGDALDDRQSEADTCVVGADALGAALERFGERRDLLCAERVAGVLDREHDELGADGGVDLHAAVFGKVVDDGVVQEIRGHLQQERVTSRTWA